MTSFDRINSSSLDTQKEINFNYFGSNVEVDGDYVKIFRQYSGDGDFFSSNDGWSEAKNSNEGNPSANKYSILDTLEKYKRDGIKKSAFFLESPLCIRIATTKISPVSTT